MMKNLNGENYPGQLQDGSRKSRTPWIVFGLVLLFSLLGLGGGFGGFLILFAIFAAVLAFLAMLLGRGEWIWLANRKEAGFTLLGALVLLIAGIGVLGATGTSKPPVAVDSVSTVTATPSVEARPTSSPSPSTTTSLSSPPAAAEPIPVPRPLVPAPKSEPAPPPPAAPQPVPVQPPAQPRSPAAYYKNCDAARAAGVAPLLVGQPGYRAELDRDGDGVACEPKPKGKK